MVMERDKMARTNGAWVKGTDVHHSVFRSIFRQPSAPPTTLHLGHPPRSPGENFTDPGLIASASP